MSGDDTKLKTVYIAILALIISIISLSWNVKVELDKRKANVEIWQRRQSGSDGGQGLVRIQMLFRNLNYRPTAIIEIFVRAKNGKILGGLGYYDRINLPIKIEAWGVTKTEFLLKKEEVTQYEDIFVRDIENNTFVLAFDNTRTWTKASPYH